MDFRLTFDIEEFQQRISYRDKILLAGTCFTENIGLLMDKYLLDTTLNPFGILYNPISIATSLQHVLGKKQYAKSDLFFHNDLWASWNHHGFFSNPDKNKSLEQINTSINNAFPYLSNGSWLVVTFGSAWAYKLKATGEIVGNCHKYPNKEFEKVLLTVAEITEKWQQLIAGIKTINPGINIIFTVSPVRYVRDGVVENNLSKAVLLQAVHGLVDNSENTFYFPAYELVMDDLRDYRFFEADNVHPNAMAIEYVWERFIAAAFDNEAQVIYPQVKALVAAAQHRPFFGQTQAHANFLQAGYTKTEKLLQQYPFLRLEGLLEYSKTGRYSERT